jgi:hypothetical protein
MRWLADQIDRGLMPFDQMHHTMSVEEAATVWILHHHALLPRDLRPPPEDAAAFANLFASYLVTSFDLLATPPTRSVTRCGCPCIFCTTLVSLSHLQPKKVTPIDKTRATRLEAQFVEARTATLGRAPSRDAIARIVADDALREARAMTAYAAALLRRLEGSTDGPEVLALWRRFAWTRSGSPKKDFVLTADAVLQAEADVDAAILTHTETAHHRT